MLEMAICKVLNFLLIIDCLTRFMLNYETIVLNNNHPVFVGGQILTQFFKGLFIYVCRIVKLF